MIGMTAGFHDILKNITETKNILQLAVTFIHPWGYLFP